MRSSRQAVSSTWVTNFAAHNVVKGERARLYWDDTDRAVAMAFVAELESTDFPIQLVARYARIDARKFFQ
jgi:hypothetical protein